jgi:hypothetical protein
MNTSELLETYQIVESPRKALTALLESTVRGRTVSETRSLLDAAAVDSLDDTIALIFYTRDPRVGLGERKIGRDSFEWLIMNHPLEFVRIFKKIPKHGRYDDLVFLLKDDECQNSGTAIARKEVMKFIVETLKDDVTSMKDGGRVSFLAKWIPSENCAMNRDTGVYNSIVKAFGVHKSTMRKNVISPLRKYIDVIERKMCAGEWDKIDHNSISRTLQEKYIKAFIRHSYEKHDDGLVDPDISAVDIVMNICSGRYTKTLEELWNCKERKMKDSGSMDGSIAVVDTSISMHGDCMGNNPIYIALVMGLLTASSGNKWYSGHVMTFNGDPKLVKILDSVSHCLTDRIDALKNISWGKIDLVKTFGVILEKTIENEREVPKEVLVITDTDVRYLESIKIVDKMYFDAGVKRPKLRLWNASSRGIPKDVGNGVIVLNSGSDSSDRLNAALKAIL